VIPMGCLTNVTSPLANSVTVHAYPSYKRLLSVQAHHGVVSHSCLSPDGTSVFTVSAGDESMKMWKIWGKREDLEKRESVFDRYAIR
jgi:cell division cycle protein 20 (cofactor of APC complex)